MLFGLVRCTMARKDAAVSDSNGAAMSAPPPAPSSLQARDLPSAVNSRELLEAHVARTRGKVCLGRRLCVLHPHSNSCCNARWRVQFWVVTTCRVMVFISRCRRAFFVFSVGCVLLYLLSHFLRLTVTNGASMLVLLLLAIFYLTTSEA